MYLTTKVIISAFDKLGGVMKSAGQNAGWPGFELGITEKEYNQLQEVVLTVKHRNQWFTPDSVRNSLTSWSKLLTKSNLENWVSDHDFPVGGKKVAIVMAGNLPLVGFHDLLSVVVSGNIALVKMSSDDNVLLPCLLQILFNYCPELKERIQLLDKLVEFDAVIATGSNNTSRYFESYFGHVPHIIRKNRTSVAIVKNDISENDLKNLGSDIFNYFGLGCRNITKVYFEKDFNLDRFFEAIYSFGEIINMNKYANNYDYNKAIFLLNKEVFLENGFLIITENAAFHSPIGVLHYEFFINEADVLQELKLHNDQIQCVVSAKHVLFGKTQYPNLSEYADNIDTLKFLSELTQ